MTNFFHAAKRESAVDLVVNHIKQLLVERKLKPGDRLPNELEISEGMGVSRGSVREAMKILSAFGLIEVKVGNGTYVSDAPGNSLIDSFLFSFYLTNPNLQEMYEFRRYVEIDILQLILQHSDANGEQRREMQENLRQLSVYVEKGASPEEMLANDLAFHRLLGKASCNVLMERIYSFIIDFMQDSIAETHKKQKGEFIYRTHKKIFDVIESNNFDGIEEAVTESIDVWSDLQDPYKEV